MKNCKICGNEIISLVGEAKRTQYCSEVCAETGNKRLQKFYRNAHRKNNGT